MGENENLQSLLVAVRSAAGGRNIRLALILGSGFSAVIDRFEILSSFPYSEFDCFPAGRVAGHQGCLHLGSIDGRLCLLFAGRFHTYQGLSAYQAALPVRIAEALGVRRLLLTAAVGGIAESLKSGDLCWVDDHLNLLGDNPLRGLQDNPFVDLCDLYDSRLYPVAAALAEDCGLHLGRGVLAAMAGPSYETPAEIRMLQRLGADLVGMSTVPEAIQAARCGMQVVALALVTNRAAGLDDEALSHNEVLQAAARVEDSLADYLYRFCSHLLTS